MSEPTNPLFEEEKAFLERKKLEYERALRGDVAQLKEQTANAGRIAMVGAGLAGSIWLITKVLGKSKRTKQRARYEDYDRGEYDQDEAYDYPTQYFGDSDFADDPAAGRYAYNDERAAYDDATDDYATERWQDDAPDYFAGTEKSTGSDHGAVYHSDSDTYDNPGAEPGATTDLDDNGLSNYPDFPEHSGHQHGALAAEPAGRFESEAYGHPDSTLPFDDSRRLPESEDFTAANEVPLDQHPGAGHATEPSRNLGSMLVGFAKSSVGKVVLGQAFSIAMSLAAKAIKDKLPSLEAETAKTSDLAVETGSTDGYAHGHPATPQPDATTAPADYDASSRF